MHHCAGSRCYNGYFCFFNSSSNLATYGSVDGASPALLPCGWLHPHLEAARQQQHTEQDRKCRDKIGGEPIRRLGEGARAILCHKILLDLFFAFALGQHAADQIAPLAAGFRGTDIQRRALAYGTVQLLGDAVDFIVRRGGSLCGSQGQPIVPRQNKDQEYKINRRTIPDHVFHHTCTVFTVYALDLIRRAGLLGTCSHFRRGRVPLLFQARQR
jgi:hypothetical protein